VARAAPNSRFIVDPNEGWTFAILTACARSWPTCRSPWSSSRCRPTPTTLEGYDPPYVICADESVHVGGDLAALRGRYQAVNLKLDKTGGLSEAVRMLEQARALASS
jgi:L-alanine-DL-glutamate epimerase-like enolase superfamily enzyme